MLKRLWLWISSNGQTINTVCTTFFALLTTIATLWMAMLAQKSVDLLFTQTPLYQGDRPELVYYTSTSNSNKKDNDEKYCTETEIVIENKSTSPATDVHILYWPLLPAGNNKFRVATSLDVDEINVDIDPCVKHYVIKLVPANSIHSITLKEYVSDYPIVTAFGLKSKPEIVNVSRDYSGHVMQIYTQYGAVRRDNSQCMVKQETLPSEIPMPDERPLMSTDFTKGCGGRYFLNE